MMVAGLSLLFAAECSLIIAALSAQVPIALDQKFLSSLFAHYQKTFQPERELLLYSIWMGLTCVFYGLLYWITSTQRTSLVQIKRLFWVHLAVVLVMLHASLCAVVWGNPFWAWPLFGGAFAVGVVTTLFWPEAVKAVSEVQNFLKRWEAIPWLGPFLGCLAVFLIIFMPDPQAVVAWMYMGEYFHNWDVCLTGAVFAVLEGLRPGVDVLTSYGFGAPVWVAQLLKPAGGFDYAKVLIIIMTVGIVYFSAWFLLLRQWLKSGVLAFAAVIIAIRLQLFNGILEPFIWAAVMGSIFRYCFDVGVFWMIWRHMMTGRWVYLFAAAGFAGFGMFHLMTTGLTSLGILGLYLLLSPSVHVSRKALVVGSALLISGLLFFATVGVHIFSPAFWHNVVEYNSYFVKGVFSAPILKALVERKMYVFVLGGLLCPVLYMLTVLHAATETLKKKSTPAVMFAGLVGVYGLAVHTYYIFISSQWANICLPAVFLVFYWIGVLLPKCSAGIQKNAPWVLAVLALYGLWTTPMFVGYPNLLNFSSSPIVDTRTAIRVGPSKIPYFHQLATSFPEAYKVPLNSLGEKDEGLRFESDFKDHAALKDYYAKEVHWPKDVELIQRLTAPGSRVPLVASFEVLLLKQADRKPFFYYFPLTNSHPMRMRNFIPTQLFSYGQLQKTIDQLEQEKPPYLFMEKVFLTRQVPQAYFFDYEDFIGLIRYIDLRYEAGPTGQYLVAMKRKQGS